MGSERVHYFSHCRYDIGGYVPILDGEDFVSNKDKSYLRLWVVREDIGFDPIVSCSLVGAEGSDLVVWHRYGDVEIGLREES